VDTGALREAIWDRFAGDQSAGTVYAAVSGQMRYGRKPDTWSMPYILYSFVSAVPYRTYGINTYDRMRVSFTVQDERDQANIDDIGKKLRARFDDCTLSFAGAELSHVHVTRIMQNGPVWVANPAGGGVWRDVTDYEVEVKEN